MESNSKHTHVFRETGGEWRFLDFLSEQIFLVQEKNDRSIHEPFIVTDGVEKFHAFVHTILKRKETVK